MAARRGWLSYEMVPRQRIWPVGICSVSRAGLCEHSTTVVQGRDEPQLNDTVGGQGRIEPVVAQCRHADFQFDGATATDRLNQSLSALAV
jgi:hypothetical protein